MSIAMTNAVLDYFKPEHHDTLRDCWLCDDWDRTCNVRLRTYPRGTVVQVDVPKGSDPSLLKAEHLETDIVFIQDITQMTWIVSRQKGEIMQNTWFP